MARGFCAGLVAMVIGFPFQVAKEVASVFSIRTNYRTGDQQHPKPALLIA
jgi:hypothetical protein